MVHSTMIVKKWLRILTLFSPQLARKFPKVLKK